MTIQEKIDALRKEFETKIAELEKQAKAEEKQSKVWKPKEGEACWCIFSNGIGDVRVNGTDFRDEACLRGSFVKTKEEAEWRDQHRIVAFELECFVKENDPSPITDEDWEENSWKHFLAYDTDKKTVDVSWVTKNKVANQVYARFADVLVKAIEHIGEERLKKYYFGVEK